MLIYIAKSQLLQDLAGLRCGVPKGIGDAVVVEDVRHEELEAAIRWVLAKARKA